MSSSNTSDILQSIPIYLQLPPQGGDRHNRHVLITVHLLRVGPDNVRIETAWNIVDSSILDSSSSPRVVIPRRPGVQTFIPRDPFDMPIYVIVTRRNRFGTSYHVATALQLYMDATDSIDISVEFFRVRKRNVLRSAYMRIVRGGELIPTEAVVGDDSCEAGAAEDADSAEMDDGTV